MKFGLWLRTKRNFLVFSMVAFGLPFWLLFAWNFWDFGNVADLVLMGFISIAAGLFWGVGMWHFFASRFPSLRSEKVKRDAA